MSEWARDDRVQLWAKYADSERTIMWDRPDEDREYKVRRIEAKTVGDGLIDGSTAVGSMQTMEQAKAEIEALNGRYVYGGSAA